MPFQTTSLTLVDAVARGADPSAWERFDAVYRRPIVRCARGLGLDLDEAEDVAQEVLLGLVGALPTFTFDPARGRFRTYVGRAMRNAVIARFERRRRSGWTRGDGPGVDPASVDAIADSVDEHWERAWRRHHCRLALDAVRGELEPLELGVLEAMLRGEAAADTAAAVGATPASVRKMHQRLRERLRETVGRQIRREERFGVA